MQGEIFSNIFWVIVNDLVVLDRSARVSLSDLRFLKILWGPADMYWWLYNSGRSDQVLIFKMYFSNSKSYCVSNVRPFSLGVYFNNVENAANNNRGFKLNYRQVACQGPHQCHPNQRGCKYITDQYFFLICQHMAQQLLV